MANTITLTIEKVTFVPKWVEFYFKEEEEQRLTEEYDDNGEPTGNMVEHWSRCTRTHHFYNALAEGGLTLEYLINESINGLKSDWTKGELTRIYLEE